MTVYLKVFLGTAIPFGLIAMYLYGIRSGLLAGLVFGGLMALILGTINILFTPKTKTVEEIGQIGRVHQTRNLILNLPFEEAFNLCVQSIEHVEQGRVIKEDRATGRIEAKTGMTWKTFGDTIEFNLKTVDADTTKVELSSKPTVPTTFVDYGKNLQNIRAIETALDKHIRK